MLRPTFTILIPTTSRPTLAPRTLRSIVGQLLPGDEVLLVAGGAQPDARRMFNESHLPGRFVELPARGNDWGHTERNLSMHLARTSHLMHLDDDDEYRPGAIAIIRAAVTAELDRPHIFRMWDKGGRWPDESRKGGVLLTPGNVCTPNIVHPVAMRAKWLTLRTRGGDGHFIVNTCRQCPEGPVIHDEVTVLVGGATLPVAIAGSI